jgi:hypothetical protein
MTSGDDSDVLRAPAATSLGLACCARPVVERGKHILRPDARELDTHA